MWHLSARGVACYAVRVALPGLVSARSPVLDGTPRGWCMADVRGCAFGATAGLLRVLLRDMYGTIVGLLLAPEVARRWRDYCGGRPPLRRTAPRRARPHLRGDVMQCGVMRCGAV